MGGFLDRAGVDGVGDVDMRWIIFQTVLKPLIRRNYAQRRRGELSDEWYWADELAISWGYYVSGP